MAVVVPWWIARTGGIGPSVPGSPAELVAVAVGVASLALGIVLFVACFRRFHVEGEGTLAPWDPPRRLVVRGPYAYVRNPMISGVLLVLVGEGMMLRSSAHLGWAAVFFLINATWIPMVEEPGLRRRFGAAYDRYARHVPRLLPRTRPWRDEG
jgi:protein-S-isoprenylcysteine O-methyltransferase Ste14